MPNTKLKVMLLSHTKEPVITVAMSGRLCYSPSRIDELYESVQAGSPGKFVDKLVDLGHFSPIEHASFTFGVEGVSRSLLAQITRHRIASFSVQSQRYVKYDELNYVIPPSIAALGEQAEAEYERQMQTILGWYTDWLERTGQAEDARFVLPNAAETRMIFTMNARELWHFLSLRCCNRAQWEIRRLAWSMLGLLRQASAQLFKTAGTTCLVNACPEGKMSCKAQAQMREKSDMLDALIAGGADGDAIVNWVINNI